MSSFSFLTRGLVVVAAVVAGSAAAQPVNDACGAAEVMALGAGPTVSSTATRIDLTASAVEAVFACTTSVKNSVWYTFTPATARFAELTASGFALSPTLSLPRGASPLSPSGRGRR